MSHGLALKSTAGDCQHWTCILLRYKFRVFVFYTTRFQFCPYQEQYASAGFCDDVVGKILMAVGWHFPAFLQVAVHLIVEDDNFLRKGCAVTAIWP